MRLRLLAVVVITTLAAATPAPAAPGHAMYVLGSGIHSPGYPFTGCYPQYWSMGADAVLLPGAPGSLHQLVAELESSICGTMTADAGWGVVQMSDGISYLTGTVGFVRNGPWLRLDGSLGTDGDRHYLSCNLAVVYTTLNPAQTYAISGACVLAP